MSMLKSFLTHLFIANGLDDLRQTKINCLFYRYYGIHFNIRNE